MISVSDVGQLMAYQALQATTTTTFEGHAGANINQQFPAGWSAWSDALGIFMCIDLYVNQYQHLKKAFGHRRQLASVRHHSSIRTTISTRRCRRMAALSPIQCISLNWHRQLMRRTLLRRIGRAEEEKVTCVYIFVWNKYWKSALNQRIHSFWNRSALPQSLWFLRNFVQRKADSFQSRRLEFLLLIFWREILLFKLR